MDEEKWGRREERRKDKGCVDEGEGLASTNQNAGIRSIRIMCLFTLVGSCWIVHLNLGSSNIPVARVGAPLLFILKFEIFSAKSKSSKNSVFLFNFEEGKK
jgi:hypothetical protein